MERFSCMTELISGHGALGALKNMGIRRLFVVTDPFFMKNGKTAELAALAGAEVFELWDGVIPDPTVEAVAAGIARIRDFKPDTVVALGGGSAMDCAKAIGWFSGLHPRLIAVPTTSGSGSEVTDFAVLTHNGVKYPLVDRALIPEIAILDGDLLTRLPPALIADGGFDVLSHAAEAFVATGAGAVTDTLAADAFRTALELLPTSFSGDVSVRQRLHTASCMAGMAFSGAGLGLCHAMAHSLGALFHIPHGRLGAILLPAVLEINAPAAAAKYTRLAQAAGLGGGAHTLAVRSLKNALCRLRDRLQMPPTLTAAGADPRQIRQLTEQIIQTALADPCAATNPLPVTAQTVRRVLEEVTGRG